ncbi:beta-ketoadipate enol-lactone hydrolase [Macrolepiota fuliginosa MF-IS2]|uniref:Beta-ketoadipate enol-lactone hydrolase n=1 Tax=Macrolepiota fuliginosa MF-IS2 TaxID=1400762 RepID=A0A9P6C4A7_9AGAR|nr:beta-ketoadipate enol-lactone hydrolase [Macrolepiota fuliginosa MF-IS2]
MAHEDKKSKWIPGRYPPVGESHIADAIRQRRGTRGITPLDAALLHVPPAAEGWNTLLGAVRTKGELGGDIRELMICRVAVINGAAYEWVHHEPVGRQYGLTTAQLFVIRDITTPLPPAQGILTPLQTAALLFADASTRSVAVPTQVTETLRVELRKWVLKEISGLSEKEVQARIDDLFVEAALVVASYNMVSRFLVAVDVAGGSELPVPWPVERKEHFVPVPAESPTHTIHAVTLKTSDSAPWIALANSLLTDFTLWSLVVPYFLARDYNILLLSQRGHGQSTLPSPGPTDPRPVTIPLLASDIQYLLQHLHIPKPLKSLIGVSQGGATALAFAALYGSSFAQSIVVCDTAPRTPTGNASAWEERIQLVNGDQLSGMTRLADVTVPRWFPPGSKVSPQKPQNHDERAKWITDLIVGTKVGGFEAGARALGEYDTTSLGSGGILNSDVENVLLLAGSLDGNGKVGASLEQFGLEWNEKRRSQGRKDVEFVLVEGSGHLPMVDEPEAFWEAISGFLSGFE